MGRIDVRATTLKGEEINIEIQVTNQKDISKDRLEELMQLELAI